MSALEKWNPFRGSTLWDPIRELEAMQNRLSSLLGRRLPLLREGGEEEFTVTEWSPAVDIAEDDKEYIVKAELPGLNKENIKVSVEGGVLSIAGERKVEKEEKNKKYHRIERSYGSFTRSFTLPDDASGEKVNAEFKDGVLKVHLPKEEKAKSKSVEVKID
jgi:HSP20 family protein